MQNRVDAEEQRDDTTSRDAECPPPVRLWPVSRQRPLFATRRHKVSSNLGIKGLTYTQPTMVVLDMFVAAGWRWRTLRDLW